MKLTPKTKIDDLLGKYPFLLEFFLSKSRRYKLLKNPVTRKTIGKVATMAQVASLGDLDINTLLSDIADEIRAKTGNEVEIGRYGAAGAAPDEGPAVAPEDSRARQEILKGIIRDLQAGEDMEILKRRFHELIRDIDASEIAAMEQGLIAEGMPESEVKRLCDVHVEVFQESLESQSAPKVPPGHPIYTYMLENRAAEEVAREMAHVLDRAEGLGEAVFFSQYQGRLEQLMGRLAEIDLHYLRKENQLFPILEDKEITGPSQVMWALHDDIRDALRTCSGELAASQGHEALNTARYLIKSINDMVYKEEHILFPMAMEILTEADWQKVARGESEIGYAWIVPETGWAAKEADEPVLMESAEGPGSLDLDTGQLTPEQINLILTHLPVEINFVDENDEVRYFSKVKEKIFPAAAGLSAGRSRTAIRGPASTRYSGSSTSSGAVRKMLPISGSR